MSVTVQCLYCGKSKDVKPYQAKSGKPVYCSSECYHLATRKGKELICIYCGNPFWRTPTRVNRNEKYCSDECYNLHRQKRTIIKHCKVCGMPFNAPVSISDRYSICSDECRQSIKPPLCVCKRCGKHFTGDKRYDRHYCSEECRRPTHNLECKTCGKIFRVSPGDTDRQFCSFACYRKHTGETSIEKAVRLELEQLSLTFTQEAKVGRYSVDFLLPDYRLVIETDGLYWHSSPRQVESDKRKDAFLDKSGYRVLRLTEHHIKSNIDECIEMIKAFILE